MRLQTISIQNLFGIFNHLIHLNLDDRITIIHGPNGYGKTAILRLISDIFGSRQTALRELPFETVELTFDNDSTLMVRKEDSDSGEQQPSVVYESPPHLPFSLPDQTISKDQLGLIREYLPGLSRAGPEEWIDRSTGEYFSLDEVLDRFASYLPPDMFDVSFPDWLKEFRDSLEVHLIRATRLELSNVTERMLRRKRRRYPQTVVGDYAEELATHIQTTLADYAKLSQSLDRSFPRRLVTSTGKLAMSMQQIRKKLAELEQKRNQLTEAGLLDKEAEAYFDMSSIDETKAEVLSLYITDVQEKLAVFDNLYDRIDLLRTILNRRFLFKTVRINKSDGIAFQADDGTNLAPECLSSGEQHEVVLLYQLLFRVNPNTLILIDEPELSLHIAWQEEFLKDLAQITRLSSFDVLIATHSPQIINDRWDLTVELKGPKECENTLPTSL